MQRPSAALFAGLLVGCVAQPAPSVPPSASVGTVEPEVVMSHDELGVDYILSGPVVEHDGVLHAWPVVFPTADEPPRVVHLTSDDARGWEGDSEAQVLDGGAVGLDGVGAVPSSVLVDDEGSWVMYGAGRQTGDHAVIWRATAPGPAGPWTMHREPVLEPSTDGWDSGITDHPSVVVTDGGYLMAYGGAARFDPNRNRIGFATSTDGLTWTPIDATLPGTDDTEALGPSGCGIDARTMFEPELVETDAGLRLYWGAMIGEDEMVIGAAESADGVTWSCALDGPLIAPDDVGDGAGLHSYAVIRDGGPDRLLVEVLGDASSDLWLVGGLD
jgi:hypothetical protein